ncbi:F-box/LRR-repeat protein At5g63520 isoform X1 [Manihot esculenta]|uniref:FIST C-domain domain-containing protein n=1 Tax=Manihot esculenta TaxID=3983 RepID=A0A2C9VSI9_MANES|nr:F-box/LRR-repeat protein At5g63520 isoform X1 [Manihot esculenta]
MEEETKKKPIEEAKSGFGSLSEDILEKILRRLPAPSLASAACVSKLWYQNCNRILSRPKLASAISLNPSLEIAVQEVLDKVLSEPIRPHFAIANGFGYSFCMQKAFDLLSGKMGSRTPLIVTWASGAMGRDARTNEFREVIGGYCCSDCDDERLDANSGILLTVGSVPGLKVEAIPLLRRTKQAPRVSMADDLVVDIRNYTILASGCTSPVAIIMFGGGDIDLKPIIEKLDYAMLKETVIAGDEKTEFLYRSGMESKNVCESTKYFSDAVALVFARDREKAHGIGDIQFHAALSNGVSAIGPRYKAASVRVNGRDCTTWLTAKREGEHEIFDGQRILNDINDELENRIGGADLYIGVSKHRKYSIEREKPRSMSSLAFHGVMGVDEEYLFVYGSGIRTADYFQFYHSDPNIALSSCNNVSIHLRDLKVDWNSKRGLHPLSVANECKKECIGGFVFACRGRGESFFGRPNVDSSPILENFPGVPLAGIYCGGEIGRGISILNAHGRQEESTTRLVHVFSTVYLVLSYTPASMEH